MHETLKEGQYVTQANEILRIIRKLNRLREQRKIDMLWLQHALSTRERKKTHIQKNTNKHHVNDKKGKKIKSNLTVLVNNKTKFR